MFTFESSRYTSWKLPVKYGLKHCFVQLWQRDGNFKYEIVYISAFKHPKFKKLNFFTYIQICFTMYMVHVSKDMFLFVLIHTYDSYLWCMRPKHSFMQPCYGVSEFPWFMFSYIFSKDALQSIPVSFIK